MGLFSGLKKQLLKVIEWTDASSDTIVYKYPVDRSRYEIMSGSQITVRESQVAIFVYEGKIADIFIPGRYELKTDNLPIITKLCAWKFAFETPYKGDIYFVNTKQFLGIKWGTTNPVMMRDPDFGVIRLRGYGTFSFKVNNPEKLLKECFGTKPLYKVSDIESQFKNYIVSAVSDAIAESKVPALDLAAQYSELGDLTAQNLSEKFENLGFEVTSVVIENLSLPEEVEKSMDTRSSMGILGDKMNTYTQYQAANAMRDAANNQGGGMATAGMGLGMGFAMNDAFRASMGTQSEVAKRAAEENAPKEETTSCPKCGAKVKKGAKFCPECGEKLVQAGKCPKCGADLAPGAKFCPECGEKLVTACPKCGVVVALGTKFCPECGEKLI